MVKLSVCNCFLLFDFFFCFAVIGGPFTGLSSIFKPCAAGWGTSCSGVRLSVISALVDAKGVYVKMFLLNNCLRLCFQLVFPPLSRASFRSIDVSLVLLFN